MNLFPWSRRQRPRPVTLAEECEAYLRGESWRLYASASYPVPAWAQLNRLVHGSDADLEALAAGRTYASGGPRWRGVMHALAADLVLERDEHELRTTRRTLRILEPLLLADGFSFDVTPEEFFELVVACLVATPPGDG